jgi:hypothetical protein
VIVDRAVQLADGAGAPLLRIGGINTDPVENSLRRKADITPLLSENARMLMLAALLLAGIVAEPLGSAGLFVPARQQARVAGAWAAPRRFVLALVGTVVLAAAAGGLLRLLHTTEHNLVAGVAGLVIASLIWLPVTRRWNARAHLCWSSSVFLFAVYLVFALRWTFESHPGAASTVGGVLLWVFELFAACCPALTCSA